MTKAEKKSRSFTFGNFLLSLLVLGLFIVIGLMFMLYLELSKTPETTAANYKRQQEEQAQIQVLSPNDEAGAKPVYRDKQASAPQAPDATKATVTSEPVVATASEPVEKINDTALRQGTTVKKANTTQKKNNDNSARQAKNNNEIVGEVPLVPTNTQPAKPKKPNRERAADTQGEQELKPTNARSPKPRPERKNSNPDSAINELF